MRFRVALVAVVLALAAVRPVGADIIPDGKKFISPYFLLNSKAYDDYCDHRHFVVKGDTLDAIAKVVYGDAARAADILKANPGVVAEKMVVGSALTLPPKKAVPADAKVPLAFDFYLSRRGAGNAEITRVYLGEKTRSPKWGGSIIAVPIEKRVAFAEALARKNPTIEALLAVEGVLVTESIYGPGVANRDSTASEGMNVYELSAPEKAGGPMKTVMTKSEYRDSAGKIVESGFSAVVAPLLGLLALVGAIGLLRRRRATRVAI